MKHLSSFLIAALSLAALPAFAAETSEADYRPMGLHEASIYSGPDELYEDHTEHTGSKSTRLPFEFPLIETKAVCVNPKVNNDCCYYTIYDGHNAKNVNYKGPNPVFGNETDARAWAKNQIAKMPFFLPYNGNEVGLIQGWQYNNGGEHSGLDSWKNSVESGKDVTFDVIAVAPGRVVTKLWDNWFGNTVIIEHTAANGSKYRSIYMHLRDGYTHDKNAAKAIVPPDPNANDNWAKYARFAKNNSDKLYWGQESHIIAVKVGDWVDTGTYIGKAGNTGAGGAGNGLNNDGTPMNTTRANNHLHFMMAVPNPKTAGEWVFVDTFGVYNEVDTGCYDIMKDIEYPRYFAPYYPNFHNISWDLYKFYFYYYPNMGWGPQTLSVYHAASGVNAAGAFHPAVQGPWALRGYLTSSEFNAWFAQYHAQGLRPREIQVQTGYDGYPRFTAIWQKRGNEAYYTWINMNDADFNTKWNDLVLRQGFRVEDYVGYSIGGNRYHAAIFVKDGQGFYLWHGMTQAEYQQKFNELWNLGWRTTSFNASPLPWGERYASVWMKKPGAWVTWFNLTGAGYQQKYNELSSQGYRVWKIQGYRNGTMFGAIWTK
ncbi:hypothetical protein ACES2L_10740 [Bdellovibrio bacteriovorus]